MALMPDELVTLVSSFGEPAFRARQIFEWLHNKNVSSFDDMTNLPKLLRHTLSDSCRIDNMILVNKFPSSYDNTTKYLFEIKKDNIILESVYMPYDYGNSVCVSSQAGCRMNCKICASAIHGLERNLSVGEMLSQVYNIQSDIGARVSHVVIMGSGEPLDNFDCVLKFINILSLKNGLGLGLSQRHITLSTCGIIDNIYKLAACSLQINLAVSLHAPNDDIRRSIMPVAIGNSIDSLLESCRFYTAKTGRRVTFEYALICNVNDTVKCAVQLADILHGMNCHVNLIPFNEVKHCDFKKSPRDSVQKFKEVLDNRRINVTVRRKLGADVNAACGQLKLFFK